MEARQCTAKSKGSGNRCKRRPIPGGAVCVMHGGKAPQVQMAAAERLKSLQHAAIDALARGLDAKDLTVQTRTGFGILDRTGLGPHSTVNVEGSLGERLAALDGHDSD